LWLHTTSDEKSFLYENVSMQNFLSDFNALREFRQFLDSLKSKRKQEFFQVLDFGHKFQKKKKIAMAHHALVRHC
jgi:hypothetical protein